MVASRFSIVQAQILQVERKRKSGAANSRHRFSVFVMLRAVKLGDLFLVPGEGRQQRVGLLDVLHVSTLQALYVRPVHVSVRLHVPFASGAGFQAQYLTHFLPPLFTLHHPTSPPYF